MGNPVTESEFRLEVFKAYLEDLGRIGGRHETARAFYLSVISALTVFLSLAGKDGVFLSIQTPVIIMVGLVGLVICFTWLTHMGSFQTLFGAKLETVRTIEAGLPVRAFTEELSRLEAKYKRGYVRFTVVDIVTPLAFAALFVAFVVIK